MFSFDSGYLFGVSNTQPGATPVRFGSMQGIQSEMTYKLNRVPTAMQSAAVMLMGDLAFNFTAKMANINGTLLNQLFFGSAMTTGSQSVSRDQIVTVPSRSPLTPAVPGGGTWLMDLGVQYSVSGLSLVYSPSNPSPAVGQYSVSAGTYTFSNADAGASMTLNYLYSSATGNTLTLANNWQGLAPNFGVVLNTTYDGQQMTWNLPRCVSQKLKFLTAVSTVAIPEFSFQAIGDLTGTTGNVGTFSYSQ